MPTMRLGAAMPCPGSASSSVTVSCDFGWVVSFLCEFVLHLAVRARSSSDSIRYCLSWKRYTHPSYTRDIARCDSTFSMTLAPVLTHAPLVTSSTVQGSPRLGAPRMVTWWCGRKLSRQCTNPVARFIASNGVPSSHGTSTYPRSLGSGG